MNFVYPSFLFALSAIAIPIIVHLFNFRRFKRVLFTNVRFLKEVKEETTSQAKLKHLLVLAARILAIVFLVLAFAQPFIPEKGTQLSVGESAVSVFIDNSFSMEATTTDGTLLDDAKRKAKELVEAYSPNTQFQLLTNDFEGRHQRLLSKDEFIELVDEVKISPAYRQLSDVIARQKAVFFNQKQKNKLLYVLSDFQKSTVDEKNVATDSAYSIRMVPILAPLVSNVSVDSVAFLSPIHRKENNEQLVVYLHNSGDKDVENVPIKLLVNGEQKAIGSAKVLAGASIADTLNFTATSTGIQRAEVQIADFPIGFDNTYYFTWQVAARLKILCINGAEPNPYINAVYKSDAYFELVNVPVNQINYGAFADYSFIIVDEVKNVSSGLAAELKKFVANGGSMAFFPSFEADAVSVNSFLTLLGAAPFETINVKENKVEKVIIQEGLLADVFSKMPANTNFPQVKKYFSISKRSANSSENILLLGTGESLLTKYSIGKGKAYLAAVPMQSEYTTLPKHALFLPLMYRMALLSNNEAPLFYVLGRDYSLQATALNVAQSNRWKLKKNDFEIIPDVRSTPNGLRLYISDQLKDAGVYTLQDDDEKISAFAFNYNRKESDLTYYTTTELAEILSVKNIIVLEDSKRSLKDTVTEANYGTRLWKLCILLTLLFLAIEVALLRFSYRIISSK